MEQNKEQRQIELLKILAKGCKKHPAYRAIRKATERCEECVVVWQANEQQKLWRLSRRELDRRPLVFSAPLYTDNSS